MIFVRLGCKFLILLFILK